MEKRIPFLDWNGNGRPDPSDVALTLAMDEAAGAEDEEEEDEEDDLR